MRRVVRLLGYGLLGLLLTGMAGWGVLAIHYSNLPLQSVRTGAAAAFGVGTVAAFVLQKDRLQTLLWFFVVFAGLIGWYLLIPASNDRAWQPDVSRLASATIQGDQVTIFNIRNFEYRKETNYTVGARYNWKILLSGYAAQYAYEIDGLDTSVSFDELRRRGHINARTQAAGSIADFSQRIRQGMPLPSAMSMAEFVDGIK